MCIQLELNNIWKDSQESSSYNFCTTQFMCTIHAPGPGAEGYPMTNKLCFG